MISRNVAARIIKLETRQNRPDEILLIWRRPDADVKTVTSEVKFAPGDRVICAEWFGEASPPAPRWYRNRLSSELGAEENEYLSRTLSRLVEGGKPRDPAFANVPSILPQRIRELSDNELLHAALGVAT